MGAVTSVRDCQRDLAPAARAADTLGVVRRGRRQVPQDDGMQVVKADADLERRRAGQGIDERQIAVVERCFQRQSGSRPGPDRNAPGR